MNCLKNRIYKAIVGLDGVSLSELLAFLARKGFYCTASIKDIIHNGEYFGEVNRSFDGRLFLTKKGREYYDANKR